MINTKWARHVHYDNLAFNNDYNRSMVFVHSFSYWPPNLLVVTD
jgi:hypothetical protein